MNGWHAIVENNGLKTIYDKIVWILFLFVLITYPFSVNINSLSIILLVSFSGIKLIKNKRIYFHKVHLLFFLFFLIRLLSLLYTSNISSGGRAIERSIGLIVFPLVFIINKPIFSNVFFFLKALNISTFFASVFCLLCNLRFFIINEISVDWWLDWKYNNHHLSSYLDFGPNYFSFLITINLLGMYFYKYRSLKIKMIYAFMYLTQLVFLLLLSSRSLIAFFLLSTILLLVRNAYLQKKAKTMIVTVVFIVIGMLVVSSIPVVKQRFNKTYKEIISKDNTNTQVGGYVNRLQKIKSSVNVLKENYIFGVGVGDVKDELKKQYIAINFKEGIDNSFDAHNQYLQSYLGTGFLGFILYSIILITIGRIFILKKQYFFLLVTAIYIYFSFFESLIETHKGVVLFSILVLLILPVENNMIYNLKFSNKRNKRIKS